MSKAEEVCSTQGTADLSLPPVPTPPCAPTPRRKRGRPKGDRGPLPARDAHTPPSQVSVPSPQKLRRGRPQAGSNWNDHLDRHPLSSQESAVTPVRGRRGRAKSALRTHPKVETQSLTPQDFAPSPLEMVMTPCPTGHIAVGPTGPSSTPSRQSARLRTPTGGHGHGDFPLRASSIRDSAHNQARGLGSQQSADSRGSIIWTIVGTEQTMAQ